MPLTPSSNDREYIDLRCDFHGRVAEFVMDQDRRWFDNTPRATVRHRAAVPHEFCDARVLPECRQAFVPPPLLAGFELTLMVEVRWLTSGLRTREPYYVLAPGVAA